MKLPYNDQTSTEEPGSPKSEKSSRIVQRRGMLLDVDETTLTKLRNRIRQDVETWKETSSEHHENLIRWNDLLENVVEETSFPWEGASQLTLPLIAIHLNTLHSVISRSVTTVDPLWYSRTIEQELLDFAPKVEEFINYKAKFELNIIGATRDVIWTTGRDGLGWHYVPYVDEYEEYNDVEVVESEQDFLGAFPDAEDAGMTEEEYQEHLANVRANASPENPVEIEVTLERCVYRGPKAYVVEEANMMRAPMTATELRRCRTYGRIMYACKEELEDRVAEGALWKEAVDKLTQTRKKGMGGKSATSWREGLNKIEGISTDTSRAADEYELLEGFIKIDLDGTGKRQKYFFTYCTSHDRLLGLSQNIYRKEIFIPYRLIKRANRMIGKSIPELLEELNYSMNMDIRQEQNNDTIRNVPIFKGKKSEKTGGFDPQQEENVIRPGVFWWLENPADVSVVNTQSGSNTDSVNRRAELMRICEMLVGPTQMLSGRESPLDPNAPGNKTIALIQQSNMRIEDYINEFRGGVENGDGDAGFDALGDLIVSHYYQFGNGWFEYKSSAEGKLVSDLKRRAFKGNFRMGTHGVTASMNPEIEFGKAMMWFNVLAKDQMVESDPMRHRELLSRLMRAGRLEGLDKLLPSIDEIKGVKEQSLMKQAEEKVLKDLQAKGVFPTPPPPPPGGVNPLAPPPAQGGSVLPPVPIPGAPPMAPGLPPVNNVPPVTI